MTLSFDSTLITICGFLPNDGLSLAANLDADLTVYYDIEIGLTATLPFLRKAVYYDLLEFTDATL